MSVELKPYDYDSTELLALQLKWDNDFSIRHLYQYHPDEASYQKPFTADDLLQRWAYEKALPNVQRYSLHINGRIIGETSFSLGHQCCEGQNPKTAWLSILIGELAAQGKGYGFAAMNAIEKKIIERGATRIELGVFDFNQRAKKLYEKLGYKSLRVIPNFTWWQNRLWSDHRLYKDLNS